MNYIESICCKLEQNNVPGHRTSLLLRETRQAFKLTQSEMALKLGVKRGTYQHYESGIRDAPLSFLDRFFQEFQIDPILAFFEDGEELIDARNKNTARTYKKAERFLKKRANALGRRISDKKLAYIAELLMLELLTLGAESGDLDHAVVERFDQLLQVAA